ncbi:hypothetical protein Slin15195_G000990 [Septoria linicola]|uniref:DUF7791 domain-containing protein n=1 Tax=Septoria linicola TaxID=215465 RepID=A0A9Q9AI15_9PEZI|nr:hypothetical protein Slin15195_G000990 [Septoria linicola]
MQILLTWEQADLLSGLRRALKLCANKGKICLFIDGLDEFEGEEGTVIGLMREIADLSPNIKLCVSSRPWAAFEKAFHNIPHILLQDLTRQDMDQYILDQFRAYGPIRHLIEKESSEFQALRSTMVERANGVFLWISLAVRTIVNDVPRSCCRNDIQKRLLQLPSDLEDLFRYLLFDYRKEENLSQRQSQIVQTMRARDQVCDATRDESVRAITLYQMALANSGSSPISDTVHQCDISTLITVCRDFADTLERSCSHLIVLGGQDRSPVRVHPRFSGVNKEVEIISEANRRVHYLHRTVRDFFVSSGVWPEVLARGNSDFDPHVALLRSHVLRLRSPLEQPEKHRRLDEWWHDDIVPAMTHARFSSPTISATQVELLDQLDQTLNWYWRKKAGDPLDNWARQAFGSYEERMKHRTPFHHPCLSLAAKVGCANYLHLKLPSGPYDFREGIPILTHALDLLISRRKTVYPLSSPSVINAILPSGQDPNQQYLDMRTKPDTPWLYALKCVREGHRRGWLQSFDADSQSSRRWVAILNLMLDHGADAAAVIGKDQWDPEITTQGVIEAVPTEYFSCNVWKLLERMRGAAE